MIDGADSPAGPIDLSTTPPIRLGPLELLPARREVRGPGGLREVIQPRVMQVLVALAQSKGAVVSRDVLVARCWEGLNVGEDATHRAVAKARQVADLVNPRAFEIESIPRVGYRLTLGPEADAAASAAISASAGRRRWPWRVGVIAVVGVVVLGLALVFVLRRGAPTTPAAPVASAAALKVTVLPFQVLGDSDSELRRFAGGLRAEIVDQLNSSDVGVAEPQAGAVAYEFGGGVERDGANLVVHIRLDDRRQHVTVWSEEVRNAARNADALQQEVANVVAHAATVATQEDTLAKGDPETMGLLIRRTFYALRNSNQTREAEWNDNKLLLAKLPHVATIHANFAIVSGFLAATTASPERAGQLKATAEAEATQALRLDPRSDEAYYARYLIYPEVGHWREREAVLLAGLKVAPQSALLTNHYSNFLREVGRLGEAVEFARRAAAVPPPSANRDATVLLALATAQRTVDVEPLATRIRNAYPQHDAAWNARFEALLFARQWAQAQALLAPAADRSGMDEAERSAWLAALRAMSAGVVAEKRKAIAAFAALPLSAEAVLSPHETYEPGERIGMVAMLGDEDEAFALASTYLRKNAYADSSFLFWPTLSDFRRDRRFQDLVTQVGLAGYWRASGTRADICGASVSSQPCGGG
jgi:DNA-binding winged helix-turn-helix (wHTH) protein/Tfp pilus assembly protein PilF/TolB-like protein